MVVTSPDDLVSAVTRDRRMAPYRVRRQGDGWIELEVVAQRARVPALLVRARSGNYGLILVGTDAELESAKLDTMPADTDLSAAVAPIGMSRLLLLLRSRAEAIGQRMASATLELELERSRHENDMLVSIGRALSQEREPKSL